MGRASLAIWLGTIVLFGVPTIACANLTSMTLTGPGNIVDSGVYVGPYTAQVSGKTVLIICDDYDTEVSVPLTWNATLTQVATDPSFPTGLKLVGKSTTGKSDVQDYEAAAWLAQQIYADYMSITPSNQPTMDSDIGDLSYALWGIFSSSAKGSAGFDAGALADYNTAIKGTYTLSQFSDVEFWTPNPTSASQEYITITPDPITPEPASFLLFGTGLLGVGFVLRGKRLA